MFSYIKETYVKQWNNFHAEVKKKPGIIARFGMIERKKKLNNNNFR